MIKKLTTLSAIALAFAAAPAMAQTGHVGANYTTNDEVDVDTFAAEGAAAFAWGEHLGAQVDGNIGSYDDGDDNRIGTRINGHLFFNGGAFRAGGLFGYSTVDYDGIAPEATHWGVEGQYNFGQFVLGGSAVWGESEGLIVPELDYENIEVNGTFYATDNLAFGARYGSGSLDAVGSVDTTNYSLDVEYQFSNTPISLIASWQHWELDGVSDEPEGLTIGARWNFGGTLRERDGGGFRYTPTSVLEQYFGTP